MASQEKVKQYLAYWFQLGKRVLLDNGQEAILPALVFEGDRYSREFESCWQRILASKTGNCYLEGTEQSIHQLLSPGWDINPCARCGMPVPTIEFGIPSPICPCYDLPSWPNSDLPSPRSAVDSSAHLNRIRERLGRTSEGF
jgi:hypothetical protein